MGELVFGAIQSLDGYSRDAAGGFDWAAPSEEVHAFVNELERPLGTYLYGRALYETMVAWETMPEDDSAAMNDYATIWRAAEKVVYSTTLAGVASERTRIERTFDADAIRALKATSERDIGIGGPTLGATALRAGLVDRIWVCVNPVLVGGGLRSFPHDLRLDLELVDERRFSNGVVYLGYRVDN